MNAARCADLLSLPGVGPARAALFARLGIRTRRDLLFHLPRAWRDWRRPVPVAALAPGLEAVVRARLTHLARPARSRGRTVLRATFEDATGRVAAVWYNAPFLARSLQIGRDYVLAGRVAPGSARLLVNPEWEPAAPEPSPHAGRIVPVYPATEGLSQRTIRRAVWDALADVPEGIDWMPPEVRARPPLADILRRLHFPDSLAEAARAREALAFRELFLFQAACARARAARERLPAPRLVVTDAIDRRIRARLPFAFTPGQDRAAREIAADLARSHPMRRLLVGDVGSGKTAVALYACLAAVANGFQAAILAPTALLAEQHAERFSRWLATSRVRLALLAPAASRAALARAAARGDVDLIVGTHALLADDVAFARPGLVVVDEQHRFGVSHRAAFLARAARVHALAMTATPIPRTLAIALHGDMDISVIRDAPPGRAPVRTVWVRRANRAAAFAEIRTRIVDARERAYVVCPAIGDGDGRPAGPVRTVSETARRLAQGALKGVPIAVLHGRTPPAARARILARFAEGAVRVLVATSLVEVGLDVPEATLMIVADADRFGLAALHQLRGRVGRGDRPATCYLFADPATPEGEERLAALVETTDGFALAERDLALRGPGAWFGDAQTGLPRFFRAADPSRDAALLARARRAAFAWVARRGEAAWPAAIAAEWARRSPEMS